MKFKLESMVDETDMSILQVLQGNARSGFSKIGRKIGLSPPAVAERVYKMEEKGVIRGYHADVNPGAFGMDVLAFISLTTQPDKYPEIYCLAKKQPEIIECHHISGNESLILKIAARSISELNILIETLSGFGATKTSIVLSSPVEKKVWGVVEKK